jgi:putative ABC transport system substrate-binding protein
MQQTRTIPIVFALVADPVGAGFVASFARPEGNVTGFTNFEPTMAGKWLGLLKEVAPRVTSVAFMFNPPTASFPEYFLNSFHAPHASLPWSDRSPRSRQVELIRRCRTSTRVEWRPDRDAGSSCAHRAEVIAGGSLPSAYHLLAPRLHRRRWPAVYGNDNVDSFRRAASYADRIQGAKPSELPSGPGQVRASDQPQDRKDARPRRTLQLQQRADAVIE